MRSETETKLRDVEQALKGQQAKSKQLINGLQKQVEEQSKARVRFLCPWYGRSSGHVVFAHATKFKIDNNFQTA